VEQDSVRAASPSSGAASRQTEAEIAEFLEVIQGCETVENPYLLLDGSAADLIDSEEEVEDVEEVRYEEHLVFDKSVYEKLTRSSYVSAPPFEQKPMALSDLLRSWAAEFGISHAAVDRLIKDKKENRAFDDLDSQPVCHKNRDKLSMDELRHIQYGQDVKDGKLLGKWANFGLTEQIQRYYNRILDYTFPEGSSRPKTPCFMIDGWIDGAQVRKTGVLIHCWPLAARFVAVGVWSEDGNHHFVPVPDAVAFIPFTVVLFLGSGKPSHANVLLRPFVNELIGLDPGFRSDREKWVDCARWKYIRETRFTVRLFGGSPARSVLIPRQDKARATGYDLRMRVCVHRVQTQGSAGATELQRFVSAASDFKSWD
jgi:hypothetical protein